MDILLNILVITISSVIALVAVALALVLLGMAAFVIYVPIWIGWFYARSGLEKRGWFEGKWEDEDIARAVHGIQSELVEIKKRLITTSRDQQE